MIRHKIPCLLSLLTFAALAIAAQGGGFRPDRLLLTWQNDPTSTMTIQWLETGERVPETENASSEPFLPTIPYIGEVKIDATDTGWKDQALCLDYLANQQHGLFAEEHFDAKVRLGWNEQGLVVLAEVRDSAPQENPEIGRLFHGDSMEMFLSDAPGSEERLHVVVAPGRTDEHDAPRHHFVRQTGDESKIDYAARATKDGYVIEALLPWGNLPGFQAGEGSEIAFQAIANRGEPGSRGVLRLSFFPSLDTSREPGAKQPFRLGKTASDPVRVRPVMVRKEDGSAVVEVHGARELAGDTVTLHAGAHDLGSATLAIQNHNSFVEIPVPQPPDGGHWGRLELRHGTEVLAALDGPNWQGFIAPEEATVLYWRSADGEETAERATTQVHALEYWPGKFRQRVELTGLQPGADYRFRAEGQDKDFGFRTMPATQDRPIRFAAGGDTATNQRVGKVAMKYDPDFIVWGGDLAYADGREDRLYLWEAWFDANNDALISDENRVVPIVVGIGNHEVRGGYVHSHEEYEQTDEWRQRIAPYFYQLFAFPGQPGYATLDFGDYLSLIVLDSAHSNPIEGVQTRWLEEALKERADIPHVFPVYHVPGFPSHRSYNAPLSVSIREHWVPLFEKHGIRVAFENHDHTYKRTHPIRDGKVAEGGIVYLGDGAWGVGVRPGDNKDMWYIDRFASERHAIIVTLDGKDAHFLMVNEGGQVIDEYSTPSAGEAD